MPRILLDENVPEGVRNQLPAHDVRTVQEMVWAGKSNGELLALAGQEGFAFLITGDKNIPHQQNLIGRRITIIALSAQHWPTIRANPQPIHDAIDGAVAGDYVSVSLPRPRTRRRSPPRG